MKKDFTDCAVIFQHIPKTAGNTLFSIAASRFPREKSFICGKDGVLNDFLSLPRNRLDSLDFLCGHVDYGIHGHIGRPCVYFAFLREPVDRVMSHYYFIRNSARHRYREQAGAMSLAEFIESGLRPRMNNCMVRMISGVDAAYGQCPESMLDKALENLSRHYVFLGITERFDESLEALSSMFGWPRADYENRVVSGNRPAVSEAPEEDLRVIRKYNELDIRLYEGLKDYLPVTGGMNGLEL
jgi:hypothetical protein